MTNFLFFANDNYLNSDAMNDERVKLFAKTLNDAFKQFQSLWDEYTKVLGKSEESKKNSSNVSNEQKYPDKSGDVTVTSRNRDKVSEKKWTAAVEEKETPKYDGTSHFKRPNKKPLVQNWEDNFQIFSQDFESQSLEESFINQSKTPTLQEIQNLTPKRPLSPIFSSKKSKSRLSSSTTTNNSPNGSQKSVTILNEFIDKTTKNPKDPCTAKAPPDAAIFPGASNASSSLIRSSNSTSKANVTCTSKRVEKWGLSTMYNIETDRVSGSKKKLKQSRIYVRKEKVTDLTDCDDITFNKLDNSRAIGIPDNEISGNCSKTNDSYLEGSLIQASPNYDKGASKIWQRIPRKNKSVEVLQQKVNMAEKNSTNIADMLMDDNKYRNTEITDTEITFFEPESASTQNINLPGCSNKSEKEIAVVKNKSRSSKLMSPTTNDSDTNDETLFVVNQTPVKHLTPKKSTSKKNRKLSLSKKANSSVNIENVSKKLLGTGNKEVTESEMEISLDSSQEIVPISPQKKTMGAKSNFDTFPKKKTTSPTYVYQGSPVRKKAERALLNGWDCYECEKYYKSTGLTGDELQKRKNQCSRHRSKFNERKMSQKGKGSTIINECVSRVATTFLLLKFNRFIPYFILAKSIENIKATGVPTFQVYINHQSGATNSDDRFLKTAPNCY